LPVKAGKQIFLGLDLAANYRFPTGLAVIDQSLKIVARPEEVFTDKEIMNRVRKRNPELIAVDAPLSFPKKGSKMRLCDRELRQFGSPALSPFWIASLTRRAISLCQKLNKEGYRWIEVYPRATQNVLKIKLPGTVKSSLKWRASLQRALSLWIDNIPSPEERIFSSHILDAILCAYTAYCRWKGDYQEIGNEEGKIIIPLK